MIIKREDLFLGKEEVHEHDTLRLVRRLHRVIRETEQRHGEGSTVCSTSHMTEYLDAGIPFIPLTTNDDDTRGDCTYATAVRLISPRIWIKRQDLKLSLDQDHPELRYLPVGTMQPVFWLLQIDEGYQISIVRREEVSIHLLKNAFFSPANNHLFHTNLLITKPAWAWPRTKEGRLNSETLLSKDALLLPCNQPTLKEHEYLCWHKPIMLSVKLR